MPQIKTNRDGSEKVTVTPGEVVQMKTTLALCKWLAVHCKDDNALKAASELAVLVERHEKKPKADAKPAPVATK